MVKPLVSIITPTWGRHERLLNRCIPSVQAQTYPRVEHVIVSDGPDPELKAKLTQMLSSPTVLYHPVRYVELSLHAGQWGTAPRLAGIEASGGALIGYIDDDDQLRPHHAEALAGELNGNPELAWAYSVMASWSNAGTFTGIGWGPPALNQLGTPMIMHRRETLEHGTWGPPSSIEDWELVQRWLNAGLPYGHVTDITVDVWPSAYHEHF